MTTDTTDSDPDAGTDAETDDIGFVVHTPATDCAHRQHPSLTLASACNPAKRGYLADYDKMDDKPDLCNHKACFGGT